MEVATQPGCKGWGRGEGQEGAERRTFGEVVYPPKKAGGPKGMVEFNRSAETEEFNMLIEECGSWTKTVQLLVLRSDEAFI